MNDIIFEDIKEELVKRLDAQGTFPSTEYVLMHGFDIKGGNTAVFWKEGFFGYTKHKKITQDLITVIVKNRTLGIIHEIDLQHLMPELFV